MIYFTLKPNGTEVCVKLITSGISHILTNFAGCELYYCDTSNHLEILLLLMKKCQALHDMTPPPQIWLHHFVHLLSPVHRLLFSLLGTLQLLC